MGWKKDRRQGELAFEGGFWDIPLLGDIANIIATTGSDMIGVTGQAGSDVVNTLQQPVTGTALKDMQITENVNAEDVTKLITEILATGGASALKSAPKAASSVKTIVDDIIKQTGNTKVTVPLPTGVGSASGGAKVKLKDIVSGLGQGTKNVAKETQKQIFPKSLGGQENTITRKALNTLLMPRARQSGTLLPTMPKFNYFTPQSSSTWKNLPGIKDKVWTGTKNLPIRALNTPSAFLNSKWATAPTSYGLYNAFTDRDNLDPENYTTWLNPIWDYGRGLQNYYMEGSTEEKAGSPVADYITYPAMELLNKFTRPDDSPLSKEIERQVTDAYYRTRPEYTYSAPTQEDKETTDSLSQVIDNILKFSEEDIKKLNDSKRMNKNIQKQDTTKKRNTYNFNLKDLK
jgi:hypothetical protein